MSSVDVSGLARNAKDMFETQRNLDGLASSWHLYVPHVTRDNYRQVLELLGAEFGRQRAFYGMHAQIEESSGKAIIVVEAPGGRVVASSGRRDDTYYYRPRVRCA